MARESSPKRLKALKLWLKSARKQKLKDIATELEVSPSQIRKWKCVDRWDDIPDTPPKRGAPYRNKNATGNKGGGAPKDNANAYKHGMFAKWIPNDEETMEIYQATREMPKLDLLDEQISVAMTNFIRGQKIMFVKDQDDMTKELKKEKVFKELVEKVDEDGVTYEELEETSSEREYEIQFAWDKQATALRSQAAAMRNIASLIKQYEEMVRSLPPEEVKKEHRLRVDKLKADIKAIDAKAW